MGRGIVIQRSILSARRRNSTSRRHDEILRSRDLCLWHGRVIHVMWACQSREPRPLKWPFPLVPVNWRLPNLIFVFNQIIINKVHLIWNIYYYLTSITTSNIIIYVIIFLLFCICFILFYYHYLFYCYYSSIPSHWLSDLLLYN